MQENVNQPDQLLIDGRKRLQMTQVQSVDGFTEQMLKLTVNENLVIITGENIKITSYNKATGSLTADGRFDEVKYNVKKQPFFKRVLK